MLNIHFQRENISEGLLKFCKLKSKRLPDISTYNGITATKPEEQANLLNIHFQRENISEGVLKFCKLKSKRLPDISTYNGITATIISNRNKLTCLTFISREKIHLKLL